MSQVEQRRKARRDETEKKLDSRGPIVDEAVTMMISDDCKEMLALCYSLAPIGRGMNPLTGEPNEWRLPILSKNVNGIVPDVIMAGKLLSFLRTVSFCRFK
jgi:hypothetical protein